MISSDHCFSSPEEPASSDVLSSLPIEEHLDVCKLGSPKIRDEWFYWIKEWAQEVAIYVRDVNGDLYRCDLTFLNEQEAEEVLRWVVWRNPGGDFCNPSDWMAFTRIEENR